QVVIGTQLVVAGDALTVDEGPGFTVAIGNVVVTVFGANLRVSRTDPQLLDHQVVAGVLTDTENVFDQPHGGLPVVAEKYPEHVPHLPRHFYLLVSPLLMRPGAASSIEQTTPQPLHRIALLLGSNSCGRAGVTGRLRL